MGRRRDAVRRARAAASGVIVLAPRFPGRAGRPAGPAAAPARDRRRSGEDRPSWSSARRDLRRLLEQVRPDEGSILIGMGRAGLATRVLAARFGSRWTYAGNGVAPGQVPRHGCCRSSASAASVPTPRSTACFGRPVVQLAVAGDAQRGFRRARTERRLRPARGARRRRLRELRAALIGLRGASVTAPFKSDVMPLLDEVAPTARGRRRGQHDRDSRRTLDRHEHRRRRLPRAAAQADPALRGVAGVILGAGGAARGVGLALRREGAQVAISARRPDAARSRRARDRRGRGAWPPPPGSWDLLVNATPAGSAASAATTRSPAAVRRPARLRPRVRPRSDRL